MKAAANKNDLSFSHKISRKMLLRICRYFLPFRKQIVFLLITLCLTTLAGLLPPLLIQNIVDKALPNKNMHLLTMLVLSSVGAILCSGLLNVLQSFLNTHISQNIVYDIKNQMYEHLQKMPLQFFSNVKQGEIFTRMTSDITGVQGIFSNTIVNSISNFLVLFSTAVTLLLLNWKLATLSLIMLPLFVLPTRKMGGILGKVTKQKQEKISDQNEIIQETLSIDGYKLMKLFNQDARELNKFEKNNREATLLQIKETMNGRWFMMMVSTFTNLGPILIYFYGGYLFIEGELTIGAIVSFVTLLGRLFSPVGQLADLYVNLIQSFALFERIFEYFDINTQDDKKSSSTPKSKAAPEIAFKNVQFSYQKDRQTLHNISFKLTPGTVTALVGPSGSGKSTITNLITRLYEIDTGRITFDDIDIRSLPLHLLRSQIGAVTQDSYLFNGTIKENLLYSRSTATDREIIEACKLAYIHEFIMKLPERYNTMVGNRGVKLSGGEKQRISIARVFLKNPSIIILDEATSSLDATSEHFIQEATYNLLKNKTSIIIAHRLSTIMAADKILVVKDGRIIEEGKHDELIGARGVYRDLFEKQHEEGARDCFK